MSSPFLTAEWRSLAMLNYEVDPSVLRSVVPAGTELDQWEGKTFVSMVGFLFLKTKVLGISVPFHSNFEEVNLRFYVRRLTNEGWLRGVVFIKELVPRLAIAWTARVFYNENYIAVPMSHELSFDKTGVVNKAAYRWVSAGRKSSLEVVTQGEGAFVVPGTCEEFITEHYWGYVRQRDGGTVEYQVEHPHWRVWSAQEATLDCPVGELYGETFAPFLKVKPASAFLADGSMVTVYKGRRLSLTL
jgi:uncharacterized protein YqjF (DUF2071 family)